MPRTTKKAEKAALMKQRRKVRRKLKAKQKARYDSRKGLGKKTTKSHPHRSTSTKRRHAA